MVAWWPWFIGDLLGPACSCRPCSSAGAQSPQLLCCLPSGSPRTSPSRTCPPPPRAPSPPRLRAPWLSGQKERDPLLPQLPRAGGRHPQALPHLPSLFWGAVQEGAEGLPTCTMKSQSSTSKAMSFTPSPCFTRCSPISARSKSSRGHEQRCFALLWPFPAVFPIPATPTLIPRVESRREHKHDLVRKRRTSEGWRLGCSPSLGQMHRRCRV